MLRQQPEPHEVIPLGHAGGNPGDFVARTGVVADWRPPILQTTNPRQPAPTLWARCALPHSRCARSTATVRAAEPRGATDGAIRHVPVRKLTTA